MRNITVVTGQGDRLLVDVRGHLLELDQPVEDGGTDTGPTPTEVFVASLAACVTHYSRGYLRRHGLPEHVEVRVAWRPERSPTRVGSIELQVVAPGLPRSMRDRFERVVSHCTVHNSLVQRPEVSLHIEPASGDEANLAG